MDIQGISCHYMEYRKADNGKWFVSEDSNFAIGIMSIYNMLASNPYFTQLGGTMRVKYADNRRFGRVCKEIVCLSICKRVKKVYKFSYNNAYVL